MKLIIASVLLSICFGLAADPIIIAHRGASGYYPEHTLAAYRAAIVMGADYIEPDLVVTADGELIARHDLSLSETTNVEVVFPGRQTTIDGKSDWFVNELTLAEIRQLRARQRNSDRDQGYNDQFAIPTFAEILELLAEMEQETGKEIGIYPELKSPAFFKTQGHDMGALLLEQLDRYRKTRRVFIQSFDSTFLKNLNDHTDLPLVMLVMPASRLMPHTPNVPLEEAAKFADGVGAMKYLLLDKDGESSGFIEAAKSHGLFVHAWTFRDDRLDGRFSTAEQELETYLKLGIDGLFTDFPDTAFRLKSAKAKP